MTSMWQLYQGIRYWLRLRRRLSEIQREYSGRTPVRHRHQWVDAQWSLTPNTEPAACRECSHCGRIDLKIDGRWRRVAYRWMVPNVEYQPLRPNG